MCSPPNDKYIFHFRGPNTQVNVSYVLHFYVSVDFIFRILFIWKATFSHLFISLLELCTNVFRVFGGQYQTEIKAKLHFRAWILQICQLQIRIFIYQFISLHSLWISVSYWFCIFNRLASWNIGKELILVLSSFQICHHVILV